MAKKIKPFATFETKEEFDKHIKEIYESGKKMVSQMGALGF